MSLKQIINSVWNHSFHNEICKFEEIVGHEDIKLIFNKAISSKMPVHVLLVGSPGCAKTMFLTEILRSVRESCFTIGSNTTKAGLVNQLFEKRPKFLLVDELEKMTKADQSSLLHVMETGIISETKIRKTRQAELTTRVFATANCCGKIIEPLLSRFVVLQVPQYSFQEFSEIAIYRLGKENVDKQVAYAIAEKVWHALGSRDIRDVVKIARLSNNEQDIWRVISIIKRSATKGKQ